MAKKYYTEEERKQALNTLQQFRGRTLLGIVNSVSRSGMSRRIEYYVSGGPDDFRVARVGWAMARVSNISYDVNKGGMLLTGCGMDMIWHGIYCFNMSAKRLENPKMDTEELYKDHSGNCNYFFPENYTR